MATAAAHDAIKAAALGPADVDCIITSHSTTPATPGLDAHIVNELHLRPDVLRIPATQLGCVGGAHALAWATQLVDRMPGLRVLWSSRRRCPPCTRATRTITRASSTGSSSVTGRVPASSLRIRARHAWTSAAVGSRWSPTRRTPTP
ncbi:hypothetical protein CP970_43740 [Streptomyces kanamyceticus]|uniref:Chalcone/stilbene synthase N-terminal domain-containing protein n=1 Tax=Streptomyces kanamyceticus TaxID=1967 RepID=A0A5J6GPM4_STRKN|nr:hypothetical protein CP970_43740 [Streptomyces kanamyceticus]